MRVLPIKTSSVVTMAESNHINNSNVLRKLFAIADIHVDYKKNLEFINQLPADRYADDGLVLAGDVTDHMSLLRSVLESLCKKFKSVFFVPGECGIGLLVRVVVSLRPFSDSFDAWEGLDNCRGAV